MFSQKAVALLDSGVGGLTVVKEIFEQLPHENIVYFGDTARMPYGSRSPEEIRNFVYEIIDFLLIQDIKSIVIACNSATAAGLEYYREKVDLPLIGVIDPGVRAALQHTRNQKIGVIGTRGTIESGAYEKAFERAAPHVEVYSQSCPLFVLIVENGLIDTPEAQKVAEEYLKPLRDQGVDTLILGCTHYPLMADVIQEAVGPQVKLISSAEETAKEVKFILEQENLLHGGGGLPCNRFYVSGPAKPLMEVADKLLGQKIKAYQVILEQKDSLLHNAGSQL